MNASSWPAVQGNLRLLRQGRALLETLPEAAYREPVRHHSPIGAQYRHVIEHYQILLAGLPSRLINYDDRHRDPALESERGQAIATTDAVIEELENLTGPEDPILSVHMDCGAGPTPDWRQSSLGRELQALASHTVHHYALIVLLLEGQGLSVPPEFGVAPSTLAYQRSGS